MSKHCCCCKFLPPAPAPPTPAEECGGSEACQCLAMVAMLFAGLGLGILILCEPPAREQPAPTDAPMYTPKYTKMEPAMYMTYAPTGYPYSRKPYSAYTPTYGPPKSDYSAIMASAYPYGTGVYSLSQAERSRLLTPSGYGTAGTQSSKSGGPQSSQSGAPQSSKSGEPQSSTETGGDQTEGMEDQTMGEEEPTMGDMGGEDAAPPDEMPGEGEGAPEE